MSRVGQTFLWSRCVAVVTAEERSQVYTMAVLHDSGDVTWLVKRLENHLIKWEEAGRRVA